MFASTSFTTATVNRRLGVEILRAAARSCWTSCPTPSRAANAINDTVPLYDTYEERIKELRDWARTRARPATLDAKAADLFKGR